VWLTVLDKVARMLPENDRPGLAAKDKMWLISVKMKARPNEAGVYDVDLEAGSLLRSDGTDYQFAIRTLKTPLERDPRGIFRRVSDVIASRHAPALSFAAGQGTERYYLVRLRFEVVTEKGGGS
jgi:hypothetical protein